MLNIRIRTPVHGLHIVTLPLPFELNHVNVGVMEAGDGYLLIDTGMKGDLSFTVLEASLRSLGIEWPRIRTILITHMHPDHVSQLPRLRELTGASVAMHGVEADHMNEMAVAGGAPWILRGMRAAGTPEAVMAETDEALGPLSKSLHEVAPDLLLEGGETIETALGPAEVIWTPGHSVGHVCLYWPEQKILYSGDHLIEKITPNIGWLPERDMLSEYIASLDKLAPYDIDLVIPSHGGAFTDHRQWIERTKAHHEARCGVLRNALSDGPRTAHELVPVLWGRSLGPFHYHFGVFEVLAHLEYMMRRGSLVQTAGEQDAIRWSLAA